MKFICNIGMYSGDGHRVNTVSFKHWWQAWVFHILLNRSTSHRGTREY